jgi:hypothetical protein
MENQTNNSDDSWQFRTEEETQLAEAILAKALAAVESGQNVEQVLAGANLPEHIKQKMRRRLMQVLQEKSDREHAMARETREKSAERSSGVGKLFSMSMLAGFISKQTIEKLQTIFAKEPQLAQQVKEQGAKLLMNGVSPDLDFKAGQAISAPTVGVGIGRGQNQQR